MSGSVEFVPGSRRAKIQVAVICLTSLLVIWLVDDLPSPFRGNNNYLSWFTIVPPKLLSVAAIAWMVRKMTSSPATRLRWSLLLLNQVLGTTAIVLYGIRIFLPAERVFSMGVPVLFVLLGVIPLLLAFSCEFSARETTAVRVLDVAPSSPPTTSHNGTNASLQISVRDEQNRTDLPLQSVRDSSGVRA
jgi:hypothetical protein